MQRFVIVASLAFAACGAEGRPPDTTATDTRLDSAGPDVDDALDAGDVPDVDLGPTPPASLAARGYSEVRTIIHLHSAYSHDGCDNLGLDAEGHPNLTCVHRMKRALCSEHIGLALMTDHPSHMREQPFADLFYAEPALGDEVVSDDGGQPIAVRYACGAGEGGPDGRVTLMVGDEGTHAMTVALHRHLDPPGLYDTSFTDDTAAADLDALVAGVHAAGGLLTLAHSEETDMAAATIVRHAVTAMELYNFHANFNAVLGSALSAALVDLEPFADPTTAPPDPDLVALAMLGHYPEPALDKWRVVDWQRPITAFAGSDVHENATLPALCANPSLCDGLAEQYPNLVKFLEHGGPLVLSDGERLDAYERVFRWVQNRIWVKLDPGPLDFAAVLAAFEAGHNVVVFEVLGEATGASLVAQMPSGELVDPGATLRVGDGATLFASAPGAPTPGPHATWSDGAAGAITSVLWRTDDAGTHEVVRWDGASATRAVLLDAPGSYHLEVLLAPHHLAPALGAAAAHLADPTYRWVETNAIRVTP